MTGTRFVAVLGTVALILAAGGIYAVVHPDKARGGAQPSQAITVAGTGIVKTTPDRADFSFGAQSQRDTAEAATAATAARMRRIIDALRGSGIALRDIQTQQLSISPQYDSNTLVGYSAFNSVSVAVRNIDKAGTVIDTAVAAGATYVAGPSLFRSDRQELARSALRAAVADARAKAQAVATASGTSVGRVVSVIENGAIAPTTIYGGTGGTTGTTGTSPASLPTPVQPGEQSVEATVSVTFAAP
jgi:uncharacterized protein YggE